MARGSGTFLLAAARGDQAAAEVPGLRHGVLTWSILQGLGQDHQTANSLVQFVSQAVEGMAQKHLTEQEVVQYSTGRDFPIMQR